jgi:hypothetical protein
MRRSSPPSVSSCIVNGGVVALLRILKEVTAISICPGRQYYYSCCFSRARSGLPVSQIHGLTKALINCSFSSSPKTSWVMPYLSRRSVKVILPNLRMDCTQPASVTCFSCVCYSKFAACVRSVHLFIILALLTISQQLTVKSGKCTLKQRRVFRKHFHFPDFLYTLELLIPSSIHFYCKAPERARFCGRS